MRITISGIDASIPAERRAYTEYRLFRAVAPYEPHVSTVGVFVEREASTRRQFRCTVTVTLRQSGHLKTQAREAHLSAAIDRAADRTAWQIGRRIARDFNVKAPRSVCKPAASMPRCFSPD